VEFHGDLPDFSVSIPNVLVVPNSCPLNSSKFQRLLAGFERFLHLQNRFQKVIIHQKKGTTLIEEFSNGPNMEQAGANSSYPKKSAPATKATKAASTGFVVQFLHPKLRTSEKHSPRCRKERATLNLSSEQGIKTTSLLGR
jgi:hypothetical protein